jgi:hypothetical protein
MRIAIIGGGTSGMTVASSLLDAGIDDVDIYADLGNRAAGRGVRLRVLAAVYEREHSRLRRPRGAQHEHGQQHHQHHAADVDELRRRGGLVGHRFRELRAEDGINVTRHLPVTNDSLAVAGASSHEAVSGQARVPYHEIMESRAAPLRAVALQLRRSVGPSPRGA